MNDPFEKLVHHTDAKIMLYGSTFAKHTEYLEKVLERYVKHIKKTELTLKIVQFFLFVLITKEIIFWLK
jgi:hypothetical protein